MRELCVASLLKAPCVIGRENMKFIIDKSCFPHRKFNVGRCLPTQWVFGGQKKVS